MDNYTDKKFVLNHLPKRQQNSNKATFGKILNIAGSRNYKGAAYLSSASALRAGGGYVTLASTDEVCNSVAAMQPEITFLELNKTENGSISNDNKIENLYEYDVISIGCGISQNSDTKAFLFNLLKKVNTTQKIILDADGINIIASFKGEISLKNVILTPHPKELSRLLNVKLEEVVDNREKYARITSQTYECITLLKGHNTLITDGEKMYVNPTGNSALAKAGTGDVLTGIIAGFTAQRMNGFDAAIAGAYIHGLAGELASNDLTEYSVLASDVIEYLPFALNQVLSYE